MRGAAVCRVTGLCSPDTRRTRCEGKANPGEPTACLCGLCPAREPWSWPWRGSSQPRGRKHLQVQQVLLPRACGQCSAQPVSGLPALGAPGPSQPSGEPRGAWGVSRPWEPPPGPGQSWCGCHPSGPLPGQSVLGPARPMASLPRLVPSSRQGAILTREAGTRRAAGGGRRRRGPWAPGSRW